ncbi:MAG TPA: glycosyltransferase family 4 protein [Candidatus Sulfotelmatobacter sp.]|nr:glycosyltransferase family 4 protein [Candidatus Sulfotelmatobacter sp.]
MTRRLVIITEIISPYRIPLFNELAQRRDVDLHVIFLAETDPGLRQWTVYKNEINFSYQVLRSWRKQIGRFHWLLNSGLGRALKSSRPDVIVCGGYNYLASWQALLWARIHSTPFFLWSESNAQDLRSGHALLELLKTEFLSQCMGYVVPGRSAAEYLRSRGIRQQRIFTAVNAVDNERFHADAESVRCDAARLRNDLGLPARYFLFTGRLVREKGVFELLAAYAKLEGHLREQVGLVFVGDGAAREALEEESRAITPGMIKFTGFIQREQLAAYYALADVFILPTYTDTWGLVVNEAMTCGLPILLSRAAGCAADLVTEDWNGHIVPSRSVTALASVMGTFASQPDLCARMGANSRKRILDYSPQQWCEGIVRMMASVGDGRG